MAKYGPDRSTFADDDEPRQPRENAVFNCPICQKEITLNQLKPVADAYSCASSIVDVNDIPVPIQAISVQISSSKDDEHDHEHHEEGKTQQVKKLNATTSTFANTTTTTTTSTSKVHMTYSSTKIDALLEQLNTLRSLTAVDGKEMEKSIVFSQWTSMLDLLQSPLKQNGFGFVRLDGTMTQAQRETSIQAFKTNDKINVFLISMKAGGLGLNLTEANHVYILDPWWSPAIEAQAIDRVHRIGQTRPVTVTRFVIKNSIEERILQLQERKKLLAKSVLGTQSELKGISLQDLRILFS